jgi:hypothetical protein
MFLRFRNLNMNLDLYFDQIWRRYCAFVCILYVVRDITHQEPVKKIV